MRASFAIESSSVMPAISEADLSEQESTVKKALAIAIAPSCPRFTMMFPMNRATSFNRSRTHFLHVLTLGGHDIIMLAFK
jgi:hypothetical protein